MTDGSDAAGTKSSGPAGAGQRFIDSHTGLRGVASLLVVFYHYQYGAHLLPFETATAFFRRGYLWVDLFFVLSGFIISYTNQGDGWFEKGRARRFMIARFARTYPLHLVALLAFAIFIVGISLAFRLAHHAVPYVEFSGPGILAFLAEVLMIHAWLPYRVMWNIPSWSISAEWGAYFAFPLLASLRGPARLVCLMAIPVAFYAWVGGTTGVLDIVHWPAPLRCLAGFALGMLVFDARGSIERCGDLSLAVMQVLALVVTVAILAKPINDVAIIPGFVLLVASTWPDRGWIARLLASRPLRFLGEISYSIYLTHVLIIALLRLVWRVLDAMRIDPVIVRSTELIVTTLVILAISTLTYRYVETPARRWVTRRYLHREPRVPGEVPTAP